MRNQQRSDKNKEASRQKAMTRGTPFTTPAVKLSYEKTNYGIISLAIHLFTQCDLSRPR
jgi:hypothetical protein